MRKRKNEAEKKEEIGRQEIRERSWSDAVSLSSWARGNRKFVGSRDSKISIPTLVGRMGKANMLSHPYIVHDRKKERRFPKRDSDKLIKGSA